MALLANCHRDPKRMRRPFDVVDFLPQDLKATVRRSAGLRLTPANLRRLKPISRETAEKAMHLSPGKAQTGPARRNDLKIIESHLGLLKENPRLQTVAY